MTFAEAAAPAVRWWLVWVLWCVPAGAIAGVGLIEFNWGGPPYDGGFAGELALFGGFLALGQAPFVALFVSALHGLEAGRPRTGYSVAVHVAFEVVPLALSLPLLYGVPTGLVLHVIHRRLRRGSSPTGDVSGAG